MTKTLSILIGSTRTNRLGADIAAWVGEQAKTAGFDTVEFIDLKEIQLPKFDAPMPPMYAALDTPEAKAWAATIAAATHLVVLTPEYNQSIPASLKSALDHLSAEWKEKPSAIVSYGYMGGGKSAASHLRDILAFLKTDLVDTGATIQLGDATVVDNKFTSAGVTPEETDVLQNELRALSEK